MRACVQGMSKDTGELERDCRVLGVKLQVPPIPACEILRAEGELGLT